MNNLFAVFESVRVQGLDGSTGERQQFKIVQGAEVMEDLDLHVLAADARRAMAEGRNGTKPAQTRPVAIIVKVPLIAMRYPCAGGQVRRFQIRLANDKDYHQAMKMLSLANVPIVEAGTFPTQRPQTAPRSSEASTVPDDPRLQIGGWSRSEASRHEPVCRNGTLLGLAVQLTNLHTPHPSTPPADHRPSQMLSIKRGSLLPKQKETPQLRPSWSSEKRSSPSRGGGVSNGKSETTNTVSAVGKAETEPVASTTMTKKRKRAASKSPPRSKSGTAAPLAKRTRASAAQNRVAKRTKGDNVPALRVDDLLKQPDDTTMFDAFRPDDQLNGQPFLNEAKQSRKPAVIGATAVAKSPKTAEAAEHNDHARPNRSLTTASASVVQVSNSQENIVAEIRQFLRTPKDRIIKTGTPDAPVVAAVSPRADQVVHEARINGPPTEPSTTKLGVDVHKSLVGTGTLMADPAFANAVPKLDSWAQLPTARKDAALESFMCQAFRDPKFIELCRVMERNWMRMLVYP